MLLGVLILLPRLAFSQELTVKGTVLDETGETMIGVSILVKGTTTGTITDYDGNYSIDVSSNQTLVFSFVGYKTTEIPVSGKKNINVTLTPDSEVLDEVVVIAYGQQKKVTVTGAVSNINSTELLKSPSASLGNAISGKLPGLSTVQNSGAPGADDPTIFIRGQASLNGSNPLVLVDGVERSFTQIDPNEVADITVLKDASATAVFGVRGANGVILVTTKRGETGKTQISVSTSWGIQTVTKFLDFADSYTYANTFNQARLSDGNAPRFSPEVVQHFKDQDQPLLYPSIDWIDYIMEDYALQSQHNVSVTGGNNVARYFVSLGMLDQDGLFKTFGEDSKSNFSYQRYNYRANVDLTLGKIHELSINLGGRVENKRSIGDQSGTGTSGEEHIFRYLMDAQPFSGAGIVDGKWIKTNPSYISSEAAVSSRDGLETFYGQGYKQNTTNVLNLDLIYKLNLDFITKGLDFRAKGSYNSTYYHVKDRTCGAPAQYTPYLNSDGSIALQRKGDYWNLGYDESSWPNRDWYAETSLNYSRQLGDHHVTGLLLYNQSKSYYPWDTNEAYKSIPKGYVGIVGRVTYNYKQKYLLDMNVGYNGSENFAKGNRYGFFPSTSIGWIASEEKFWKPLENLIPYFKIRASVGTVGNDNCAGYRFLYLPAAWKISNGYYNSIGDYAGYNFGTTNTTFLNVAREYSSASPDVTWETAVKQNYGIDAKFFNSKLSVSVDFFKENRKDILINNETMIQAPTALRPSFINFGKVKNHGYEVSLSYTDKIGEDFTYSIAPSVSYAKNKIKEMAEITKPDKLVKADSYMGKKLKLQEDASVSPGWTYATGHSIGARKGYLFFEFYEAGKTEERYLTQYGQALPTQLVGTLENGDAVYVDLDGDGLISEEYDQMYMGTTDNPEYTFSLNMNFQYKKFDFSMLWTGASHVSRNLDGVYRQPFGQQYNSSLLQWVVDNSWTEERGASAKLPRITFANEKQNQANSNIWYYNSRYLRLKNVELGYNIRKPAWFPQLENMRIYLNGTNLLTFSPLDANDPENTGGGYNSFIKYPLMRVFNLGVKLNF